MKTRITSLYFFGIEVTFFGSCIRVPLMRLTTQWMWKFTLSCGVRPYLRVHKQLPLRLEQEGDPVSGPRHRESPDGEGRHNRVGEERGEVDHAAGGPDAADEAGADQDPRDQKGPDGMQARVAL